MFPVVVLLFPDGTVPRRRWRWAGVRRLVALVLALIVAAAAVALADHDVRLSPGGSLTSSGHLAGWLANPPGWLIVSVIAAIVIIGLSFIEHQVLSWRAAEGDRRQQLKWLACGGAVAAASLLLAAALGVAELLAGLAALPVGIGVGILRYRLYDIDRIISRTLAYALVTAPSSTATATCSRKSTPSRRRRRPPAAWGRPSPGHHCKPTCSPRKNAPSAWPPGSATRTPPVRGTRRIGMA